jgi:hypothetical protein
MIGRLPAASSEADLFARPSGRGRWQAPWSARFAALEGVPHQTAIRPCPRRRHHEAGRVTVEIFAQPTLRHPRAPRPMTRAVERSPSLLSFRHGTTIIIVGPPDARTGIGARSAAPPARPRAPTARPVTLALGANGPRTPDGIRHSYPVACQENFTLVGPYRATRDRPPRLTPNFPAIDGVRLAARRLSATVCPTP